MEYLSTQLPYMHDWMRHYYGSPANNILYTINLLSVYPHLIENKGKLTIKQFRAYTRTEIREKSRYGIYDYKMLYRACKNGNLAVVKDISENIIMLFIKQYRKCIEYACESGHLHIIHYLIYYDGYTQYLNELRLDNWQDITSIAIRRGHAHIAIWLYTNNYIDMNYISSTAAYSGCLSLVKYAVKHGYKYDTYTLATACQFDRLSVVKYLVCHGVPIYSDRPDYGDPLCSACLHVKYRIVKFLIKSGATKYMDRSLIYIFRCYVGYESLALENLLKTVRILIRGGANIHENGDEPLQRACEYGYLDVVKYLVRHGANVNVCTSALSDNKFKTLYYIQRFIDSR